MPSITGGPQRSSCGPVSRRVRLGWCFVRNPNPPGGVPESPSRGLGAWLGKGGLEGSAKQVSLGYLSYEQRGIPVPRRQETLSTIC